MMFHQLIGQQYQPKIKSRRGLLRRLWNVFRPQAHDMVDLQALMASVDFSNRVDRGYQAIPVRQVVGSMGRHDDFDRNFVPRSEVAINKYKNIARLVKAGRTLPPIEVYQVGALYFVIDGNHRVAVCRAEGGEFIDAHVIQLKGAVDINSTTEARAVYQNG
jgi:hypothetical protein